MSHNYDEPPHPVQLQRKRRKLPCVEGAEHMELHTYAEYYQPDVAHVAPANNAHTSRAAHLMHAMTYIPNQRTVAPGPEVVSMQQRVSHSKTPGLRVSPTAIAQFKARYDDRMKFTERPTIDVNMSDPRHSYHHV